MLRNAASVAVPKLMMYIQAILCSEEYDMSVGEHSSFYAVIIFLARISAFAWVS
jgi:hypothetical protein